MFAELNQVLAELNRLQGRDEFGGQLQAQSVTRVPPAAPEVLTRIKELKDKAPRLKERVDTFDLVLEQRRRTQRAPLVTLIQLWYEQVTLGKWPLTTSVDIADAVNALKTLEDFSRERMEKQEELAQLRDQLVVELERRCDVILSLLEKYAFPVLLGLLGAVTYILRSLIVQIREYSFTTSFASLSFVRITLGMMAGLLGGLLIPTGDGVLKSVPPLAFPFLFGYAVEVVFTFLDKVVKAFVDENPTTK